jgi:FKBP-type peptidyl-prolyl cis-trans isomerase (trigger factor)
VINEILKDTQVKFPPQMLENEIDLMVRQLENRLAEQKLDMATYLKTRRMEEADLRKELSPAAEARMKRSLTLFEIAKVENIKVEPDELQNETVRTLDSINRIYSPKEARKMVSEPFINNMVSSIAADLTIAHTFERLQEFAKNETPAAEEVKAKKTKKSSTKKPAKAELAKAEDTEKKTVDTQAESAIAGTTETVVEAKPKRTKKTKAVETVE